MEDNPFSLDDIVEQEADAHRIVDVVYRHQRHFSPGGNPPGPDHRYELAAQAIEALRHPFVSDRNMRTVIALARHAEIPDRRQRFDTLDRAADILTARPVCESSR